EESLRQSEERYRLMVSGIKDYAILMLSSSGEVVSWNDGAEGINGYRTAEMLGRHFSCLYPRSDIESQKPSQHLQLARSGGHFETEGWRVRKDGSRFWAEVVFTALYDGTGQLRGFAKIMRDISTRNQAEIQLAHYRENLEALVR